MNATDKIVPPAQIAVIGLGNMGVPMGACLVKAGYAVTGFDLSAAARERFAAAGGKVAPSPAAAVGGAKVVITLLPNGKVGRAVDGTLAIMVGGDPATIDRVDPVLAAMGRLIFRTGGLGSGHAMKALNNYVSAAGLVATVEALQVGRTFGLDPNLMADILNVSSGKNNTTEVKLKQYMISQSFNAGFPLRLMAKDVRTADDLAHGLGIATPLADLCAKLWDEAAENLAETADHTEIVRYMERLKA